MQKFKPRRWSLHVTETGTEPLSIHDAKRHLREDGDEEDILLQSMIQAARRSVEDATNRAIIQQTRVLRMSEFPTNDLDYIELPGGNVSAVSSVSYQDNEDAAQSFTGFETDLNTRSGAARIHCDFNQQWPSAVREQGLPVSITYTAGYASATDVPPNLMQAMHMAAAAMFENREVYGADQMAENPFFKMLTLQSRVWTFG